MIHLNYSVPNRQSAVCAILSLSLVRPICLSASGVQEEARSNSESPASGTLAVAADGGVVSASRVVRRVHMYLGLFLVPWMLVYALSTLVMNHRELVSSFYSSKAPALTTERALEYSHSFPTNTPRAEMAREILKDVGLDGTHRVSGGRDGKPLVIERLQP